MRAVRWAMLREVFAMGLALFALAFVVHLMAGCGEAAYPAELAACTETSSTLCESIACENEARAAKGRPLRPVPAKCQDGGVP